MRNAAGVPFFLNRKQVIRTKSELDMLLKELGSAHRQFDLDVTIVKAVTAAEFLRGTDGKLQGALTELNKQGYAAVYVEMRENNQRDRGALLVRVQGSRAHLVGWISGVTPAK